MTKEDKTQILQALSTMALALGQDVSEQRRQIYLDHLKDLPVDVVLKAIEQTIKTWKFNNYPPVGALRAFVDHPGKICWKRIEDGDHLLSCEEPVIGICNGNPFCSQHHLPAMKGSAT